MKSQILSVVGKICNQLSELQRPIYTPWNTAGSTKTKALQRIQQRWSSSKKSWNPFKCNANSEYQENYIQGEQTSGQ